MTPVLILFYGITPAMAVGTDLLYAHALSKSFGVLLYRRKGSVDWAIVGWQALGSVPASLLTLVLLHRLGVSHQLDNLIKLTLAIAVVVTATFTLFQDAILARLAPRGRATSDMNPVLQRILTAAAGALIGSVVTISSVGAGVIGMMLLLLLYPKHPTIKLVVSVLDHAVIITAMAGLGLAILGTVDYSMLGWLLLGAIPGIWIGSQIGFRLDGLTLKRAVAVLLLVVGGLSLYKALSLGSAPPVPATPHNASATSPQVPQSGA